MKELSQLSNEELAQIAGVQLPTSARPEQTSWQRTMLEQGLQGATGNFADEITTRLGSLMALPFTDESYSQLLEDAQGQTKERLARQQEERPILSTLSQLGGGITSAAGLATTAPAKALGNLAGRFGTPGAIGAGALAGESTQRVYEAGDAPPGERLEKITYPGISMGGILGGLIPGVGSAVSKVKSAFTPTIDKGVQEAMQLAKKYKIPLGLDDVAGSSFYRHLIQKGSSLPFAGATSSAKEQLGAFTKAIARSVGLDDVDNLTPVNMDKAFTMVGKKFDDLTKGKTFIMTDDALDSLAAVEEGVAGGTYGAQGVVLFKNATKDIFNRLKNDSLSGDDLVALRNKFARTSRTGSNPEAKTLAKDMENILVDMIGEGAPDALKKAKYQYKNLIAIEPLAQKAQVEGYISPALLNGRVSQVYKRDFTRGRAGELGDLARVGQLIKQKVPDSGTAIGNVVLGTMTGGSLPISAVNPIAGAASLGLSGAGLGINRLLQSRNVNPAILERAMNPAAARTAQPILTGLSAGSLLGNLQQ